MKQLYFDMSNPYVKKYFDMADELNNLPSLILKEPKKGFCLMSESKRKKLRNKRKKRK